MAYRIESGIPIPSVHRNAKSFAAVLRGMKKGQSVKLAKKKWRTVTAQAGKILGAGNYAIRSNGSTFRVWRTK